MELSHLLDHHSVQRNYRTVLYSLIDSFEEKLASKKDSLISFTKLRDDFSPSSFDKENPKLITLENTNNHLVANDVTSMFLMDLEEDEDVQVDDNANESRVKFVPGSDVMNNHDNGEMETMLVSPESVISKASSFLSGRKGGFYALRHEHENGLIISKSSTTAMETEFYEYKDIPNLSLSFIILGVGDLMKVVLRLNEGKIYRVIVLGPLEEYQGLRQLGSKLYVFYGIQRCIEEEYLNKPQGSLKITSSSISSSSSSSSSCVNPFCLEMKKRPVNGEMIKGIRKWLFDTYKGIFTSICKGCNCNLRNEGFGWGSMPPTYATLSGTLYHWKCVSNKI